MKKRARIGTLPPPIGVLDWRTVKPPPRRKGAAYGQGDPIRRRQYDAWRTAVNDRAGGQCQSPGCGRIEQRMFADHIVELKDGGAPYDVANGQCLCGSCHSKKTHAAREERHARPVRFAGFSDDGEPII
jgi:5-methylcytosine-specific restriction endonuclease McrA